MPEPMIRTTRLTQFFDGMTALDAQSIDIARTRTSSAVLSYGKLVYHVRFEAVTARYGDDAALEKLYLSLTPVGRRAEVA